LEVFKLTNTGILKNKIKESGLSITFIARKIGISREYLYQKINGAVEFKQSEIETLKFLLRLSNNEREAIFFDK